MPNRARRKTGTCHICGSFCCGDAKILSQEHVIPKSSGNTGRIDVHTLQSRTQGLPHGQRYQNGMYMETICKDCNTKCGKHYVPALIPWTQRGLRYKELGSVCGSMALPYPVRPLPVAKQLSVMTLTMTYTPSLDLPHFQRLRRFVTNPRQSGVVQGFRFFVYYHEGPHVFERSIKAVSTAGEPAPFVYCQIGLQPFGYIVTDSSQESIDWARAKQLCEITQFAERSWYEITVEYLVIPRLRGVPPWSDPLSSFNAG